MYVRAYAAVVMNHNYSIGLKRYVSRVKKITRECSFMKRIRKKVELECGPMPNVMGALPNIGGALCSTPQSLADAQYWSAVR